MKTVPEPARPACAACRYFVASKPPSSDRFGRCKRFPPTGFFSEAAEVSANVMVESSDWCGEYKFDVSRAAMRQDSAPANK